MNLKELVYNCKTQFEEGFTRQEIEDIKSQIKTDFNQEKFDSALTGITCIMKEGNIIVYRHDVLTALRCAVENRDMYNHEFD